MGRIAKTKFIARTFPCDIWFKDQAYKIVVIFGLDVDTGIGIFLGKVAASQKNCFKREEIAFLFFISAICDDRESVWFMKFWYKNMQRTEKECRADVPQIQYSGRIGKHSKKFNKRTRKCISTNRTYLDTKRRKQPLRPFPSQQPTLLFPTPSSSSTKGRKYTHHIWFGMFLLPGSVR